MSSLELFYFFSCQDDRSLEQILRRSTGIIEYVFIMQLLSSTPTQQNSSPTKPKAV